MDTFTIRSTTTGNTFGDYDTAVMAQWFADLLRATFQSSAQFVVEPRYMDGRYRH